MKAGLFRRLGILLQSPHLRISAIELQQVGVVAPFNDVPGFHDQYFMGIHHSRQAVGNDQSGFILGRAGQLGLNGTLIG
jgi:hypothetical protein